jgi:tRNA (guanine37-N1)-methyltransferase
MRGCGLTQFYAILVPFHKTQTTVELLRKLKLKTNGYKLQRDDEIVKIPLVTRPTPQVETILRKELGSFQIGQASFEPTLSRPTNLGDALQDVVPLHLRSQLPRSFDIIGDIAIIELSAILGSYAAEVGKGVLEANPHVRLVLSKSGGVMGKFRTRELGVIAGSGGLETVHHEFGCRYKLDVSMVYFNPRLAHERRRVAERVKQDEVVVDMFAGVGPYSILAAKLQPGARVYAIDINPSAVKYLRENILANEVADRVVPMLGDAEDLARNKLHHSADRVIMNLPSEAERYLGVALEALKTIGGIIHFYEFASRGAILSSVKERFRRSVTALNHNVRTFDYCEVIKEIAPSRVQVALDAVIE